jgi:hypothetical protein
MSSVAKLAHVSALQKEYLPEHVFGKKSVLDLRALARLGIRQMDPEEEVWIEHAYEAANSIEGP